MLGVVCDTGSGWPGSPCRSFVGCLEGGNEVERRDVATVPTLQFDLNDEYVSCHSSMLFVSGRESSSVSLEVILSTSSSPPIREMKRFLR